MALSEAAAREQVNRTILEILPARRDVQRPSMGQDILESRRTKTDFINDLVARRGIALSLDASLHDKVNRLVHWWNAASLCHPALVAGR